MSARLASLACATGLVLWALAARAGDRASGLAVASPPGPIEAVERQQQRLFEEQAPRVVFIAQKKGFGSGFFVDAKGLILTNAHVVGDATQVDVVLHDGRKFAGQVVERGQDGRDTALVQIPIDRSTPVAFGGIDELRVGSWVASIGHGLGGIWTFTTGMVSNIYPAEAERPLIQTQIPLNPGNSGGPVLDRQGRVIGVVTAGIESSQAINFAIRSDVAIRSLSKLEPLCQCLVVTAPAAVPIFVDGKMVGKGPRLAIPGRPQSVEVFAVVNGKMCKQQARYPEQQRVELCAGH